MYSKNCITNSPGGATTTGPDATTPPAICQNGGVGGRWRGGKLGRGGGVRATHYYHMHTSRAGGGGAGGCRIQGPGPAAPPGQQLHACKACPLTETLVGNPVATVHIVQRCDLPRLT